MHQQRKLRSAKNASKHSCLFLRCNETVAKGVTARVNRINIRNPSTDWGCGANLTFC
jgi:hypothetical protein